MEITLQFAGALQFGTSLFGFCFSLQNETKTKLNGPSESWKLLVSLEFVMSIDKQN